MYSVHNSCIAYTTGHTSTVHSLSFPPLVVLHLSLFITYSQVVHNRSSSILLCMLIAYLLSIHLFVCYFFNRLFVHNPFIFHWSFINFRSPFIHNLFGLCPFNSIHWPFIVIHHISLDVSHKCVSDIGVRHGVRPHPTNCIRNIFSPVRADSWSMYIVCTAFITLSMCLI